MFLRSQFVIWVIKEILIQYGMLKFQVRHGMKVDEILEVISFGQKNA